MTIEAKKCDYCGMPVSITSFNSIAEISREWATELLNQGLRYGGAPEERKGLENVKGMCYLKLKMYDKAVRCFDKAIDDNFNNPDTYFFASISTLNGKRPFLCSRNIINQAEKYLDAAIFAEARGIFYYFKAYIRYDYFAKKYLRVTPDFKELLCQAEIHGVTDYDKSLLFEMLGVEAPDT